MRINRKYTHFCVSNLTGKIVDGWEYDTDMDMESIKYYYAIDMQDNDRSMNDYKLKSALQLFKKGINPYLTANWGTY